MDYSARQRTDSRYRMLSGTSVKATATTVYRCPVDKAASISSIWMCNTGTSSATMTIHHLRPNESVATSNALVYGLTCNGNTTTLLESTIPLVSGDSISALSSSTNMTIVLYGTEA